MNTPPPAEAPAAGDTTGADRPSALRVLIVDDLVQNLYLLRALLRGHGYLVDEARHGAEALLKARQLPPDLVVSDLLMPVMDGYSLLRHWRSDERLKAIPFVVYTATYTDAKDEQLALALGADAFVIKPAEPEALTELLATVLAQRARPRLVVATAGSGPAGVAVSGPPRSPDQLLGDYSEVLVRKLEKRAKQLERSNQDLLATIEACRRTEAALQDSEERFRATFEQAAVGIAHVGMDGSFLRVNDRLCQIVGHAREELVTMRFADLTLPEDQARSDEARQAMLAGTMPAFSAEKRYRRKDGTLVWISLVSTLLRDQDGQAKYFISVITDISEQKALQEQVRQAQKLEAVGQLTGGIAHDFNNLLTVILGNAELLVDRLGAQPELLSLADMVRTAASRGADLTQHLLAFARRQALDPRNVDVNGLLRSMNGILHRMLPATISIEVVCAAGLWPALVDASQLEAAVLNLCINARDAMPDGGRLTLEAANVRIDEAYASQHSELNPGQYVLVAVSDTGTGIAADHLTRVFEPFFTTKPVGQGTGLGLSMVYGFVKQSGGHAKIYSEPGQGTSVKLYLPRGEGRVAVVVPDTTAPAPGGTEDVLLVEDNELVRHYATQQLSSLGYRVVAAEDGAAAMTILSGPGHIDLLFTDVVMPGGMDGQQLATAARRLRPGLKVLFCSGYADNAIVHHGRLDPGVHVLGKPYGRAELARKLRTVLATPVRAPAQAQPSPAATSGAPVAGQGRLLILDDDPMVGKILSLAAEHLGFQTRMSTHPDAFFDQVLPWAPSHVAIDLSMPAMGGRQVLDRLAEMACTARVIISSGADMPQMLDALDHARALGLAIGGALPKPFSAAALRALLQAPGNAQV